MKNTQKCDKNRKWRPNSMAGTTWCEESSLGCPIELNVITVQQLFGERTKIFEELSDK